MTSDDLAHVETANELVALFFVAKKAGTQRFIIDAHASNRHFFEPYVEFQRAPEDAKHWFVGCSRYKGRVSLLNGCKRSFALPAVLASRVG